jgi:hypothetical protein
MAGASVFPCTDPGTLDRLREQFIKDKLWLDKNIDQIRKAHTDRFVAVMDRKVIDSNADMRKLLASLSRKNIQANNIVIEYITASVLSVPRQ